MLLALRPARRQLRLELVAAGGLVAIAFLLKQPSGIAGLPLGIYLLLPDSRARRGLSVPASMLHAALLTLGFTSALGGAALWLGRAGILHEAFYWTITSQEAAFGPLTWVYWDRALSNSAFFAVATLPLLLGVFLSVGDARRPEGLWKERRAEFTALVVLLAGSAVGVGANGQFLFHYYLQLILPLSLLAAPVYSTIWEGKRPDLLPPRRRQLLAGWLALSAVVFLMVDTIGLSRNRELLESGRYVREHSSPEDRIFVWGQGDRFTQAGESQQRRAGKLRQVLGCRLRFRQGGMQANLQG
jgi:hypothetical protein